MPKTLTPAPTDHAWEDCARPPMNSAPRTPVAWSMIRTWVLISAFFNLLGWTLAATSQLDERGYAIGFVVGGVLLFVWLRHEFRGFSSSPFSIPKRRWRRALPRVFALLLVLISLGAALHHPNNYDALTYRVPQVLHWLAAHRWHWIVASDPTLNITPPGQGWFFAPAIAFFKSDRLFALPNVVAFALIPGFFFSILRQCRVGRRVAWSWMWLLPAASCVAMQAGGIGNDLLPGVYALAAVALGIRAARRQNLEDFWLSALAAAMVSGVKLTAAPLALPWLVATLPCWKLILRRWLGSVAVAALALVISFLPTAALNTLHTGAWNGDPKNQLKIQVKSPVAAAIGNSLMVAAGAVELPVCPFAGVIKARYAALEKTTFLTSLRKQFPRFGLSSGEMATEEAAGLGIGLTLLAALSFVGGWSGSRFREGGGLGRWIGLASYAAFGAYLLKMGSEAAPRLAAPYYPFLLIPLLRARIHIRLVRQSWWRILALLVALSIVPAVILTPSRPLWPAQAVLARLVAKMPGNALLARSQLVYRVYSHRDDDVAVLKPLLPSDGRAVGYVRQENDIEAPLWKPYSSRRIVEVLPPEPDLTALQGSVIIASKIGIQEKFNLSPPDFAAKVSGRIIGQAQIYVKVGGGPQEWVVISLGGTSPPPAASAQP